MYKCPYAILYKGPENPWILESTGLLEPVLCGILEGRPYGLSLFLSTAFYPARQTSPSSLQRLVTTLSSSGWVWALYTVPPSWGGELSEVEKKGMTFSDINQVSKLLNLSEICFLFILSHLHFNLRLNTF